MRRRQGVCPRVELQDGTRTRHEGAEGVLSVLPPWPNPFRHKPRRLAGDIVEGLGARPCGLVRPHGSERVVDIGDGDDARAQRDVIADEAVRVARAVVLLVVAECDQRAHAHVFGCAALQDLVPDHRMTPHDVPLRRVELRRLEQDLVGDADLADVVQRRGELDGFRLVVVETDRVGDEARVARHADQVIAGFLVAKFARAREAQQRLLLALAHFTRRVLDHVLEEAAAIFERELLPP